MLSKSREHGGRALQLIHRYECKDINIVDKKLSGLITATQTSPRGAGKAQSFYIILASPNSSDLRKTRHNNGGLESTLGCLALGESTMNLT
jgi:hypothetical protein